ncbi:MAG: alanine--tRNA ligase [Microbacteriaceae bacterium]
MKTSEIRQRWLDFFEKRGHVVVPSASLISDDPTLLFTIAGMVPFVPYLTGVVPAPYPRATSVQKCIRTNDIEEVGKTPRHGTFFQMNGNFSFGDYFKREAIEFAWQLLTSSEAAGGYGFLPKDLWVTIFEDDDEAHDLWREIADLPEERIQRLGRDTNYWHTGQYGPGGPCSEIFFDRGPDYGIDGGPATDDDRYVEIWNLVFMQYLIGEVTSKVDFEVLGELPKKNIDTGMGLERIAFLKQGVENMYEIDEIRPVLDAAATIANVHYGEDHENDVRLRVVADHIRSSLMLISDGVTPANEARGYILRRLLRRTVRAMRLMGVHGATFPALFAASRDAMKASYPEVASDYERISTIAFAEEEAFLRTLVSGTNILEDAVAAAKTQKLSELSGSDAFLLHDTYGFPIDLTLEMAEEAGLSVDRKAFDSLMQEQRQRAKADAKSKKQTLADLSVYREFRAQGETNFSGYTELESEGIVLGIIRDGKTALKASAGDTVEIILDNTALYAEGGGQDADQGFIRGDGFELEILDVQKPVSGLISHLARVNYGEIAHNMTALSVVDAKYRHGANQAHSATHVIHAALREVLGKSAHQSGSYNKAGYMRLDFSWGKALSAETRTEVEDIANQALRSNYAVSARLMPIDDAKTLGAMALFGEKYGNVVRMVEMNGAWSRELCAGTHVASSSEIGLINLISESSVGSANRRVEALVGFEAFKDLAVERSLVSLLSNQLKTPREQLPARVSELLEQLKAAEHKVSELESRSLATQIPALLKQAQQFDKALFASGKIAAVASVDALRQLALETKNQLGTAAAVSMMIAEIDGKPSVVIAVNEAAIASGIRAGDLVKQASLVLGGGGGGRPDIAQGGGTELNKIDEAVTAVAALLG